MKNLLVILGAGASADSVDTSLIQMQGRMRPPLAVNLFGDGGAYEAYGHAVDRYPDFRPLIIRLRRAVGKGLGVEEALREIQDEASASALRARQLLAVRFYLRWIISEYVNPYPAQAHGLTNHVSLVDSLQHWRIESKAWVSFITFNYDNLLEQALTSVVGRPFTGMGSYLERGSGAVFKVHGSADWVRVVENALPETDNDLEFALGHAHELKVTDSFLSGIRPDQHGAQGALFYPALAIPVERKEEFEMPDTHFEELLTYLELADGALIIGWRGADRLLLETWVERRARARAFDRPTSLLVHVVSDNRPNAELTLAALQEAGIDIHSASLTDGGFSRFMSDREHLDHFLNQ